MIMIFSEKAGAVKEYQVVHESFTRIEIRIVPTPKYSVMIGEDIVAKFKAALPGMDVRLRVCTSIERERSGKLKVVKSSVK
jgi:hypothetical protein